MSIVDLIEAPIRMGVDWLFSFLWQKKPIKFNKVSWWSYKWSSGGGWFSWLSNINKKSDNYSFEEMNRVMSNADKARNKYKF